MNALKVSDPPFYKDTQRRGCFVKVNVKTQCFNLPNEKLLVPISSFHDSPVVGLTRDFTVIENNSLSIWQLVIFAMSDRPATSTPGLCRRAKIQKKALSLLK